MPARTTAEFRPGQAVSDGVGSPWEPNAVGHFTLASWVGRTFSRVSLSWVLVPCPSWVSGFHISLKCQDRVESRGEGGGAFPCLGRIWTCVFGTQSITRNTALLGPLALSLEPYGAGTLARETISSPPLPRRSWQQECWWIIPSVRLPGEEARRTICDCLGEVIQEPSGDCRRELCFTGPSILLLCRWGKSQGCVVYSRRWGHLPLQAGEA